MTPLTKDELDRLTAAGVITPAQSTAYTERPTPRAECPPGAMLCGDGCFRDKRWVRRHGTTLDQHTLKHLP